ncbi:MAG: FAD-dependent oxidoreductase [Patescibacteria group bacterium]
MESQKKIAVIGAGIAGLSCAYELKKVGFDVTVFEKNDFPGGRMSTRRLDKPIFDIGADFLSDNYEQIKTYATEFNIEWRTIPLIVPDRVIRNGKPHYLDLRKATDVLRMSMISPWARFKFLLWLIKEKLLTPEMNFFDLSTVPTELDKQSGADFLLEQVHREVRDYIADPFAALMHFHSSDEISAGAITALLQMFTTPGKQFSLRITGGGIGRIPEELSKRVKVEYNTSINNVVANNGHVDLNLADNIPLSFDVVVVATTASVADKILLQATKEQKDLLTNVRYASTMTVGVLAPRDLFECGAQLTYVPFVENSVIGGYDNQQCKGDEYVKDEKTLVNIYLQEEAAKKMWSLSDGEVFDIVKKEFKKVCPELISKSDDELNSKIELFGIAKWPEAMPKFYAGYLTLVRKFLETEQGKNNIYLAGDYLNSPWTEGAARCGKRVAKMIIDRFS